MLADPQSYNEIYRTTQGSPDDSFKIVR
jgi:hypothetical protein